MKNDIIIIADYSKDEVLSLEELIEICHISPEFIDELIAFGVVDPHGNAFDMSQLERIQKAQRLQRDLEVNLAGVAVVLDLLDDLEAMRARLAFLEKHLKP